MKYLYKSIPISLPDLNYPNGLSQNAVSQTLNGFSFKKSYRMPRSPDILMIEYFLEPGCIILVTEGTANVRFLPAKPQREWRHRHYPTEDFYIYKKNESLLGSVNHSNLATLTLI